MLAGNFSGTLAFADRVVASTDKNDVFVVRLDAECHVEWAQQFIADGWVSQVELTPDGGLVLAGLSGPDGVDFGSGHESPSGSAYDTFVAKLERSGAPAWTHIFSGNGASPDAQGAGVVIDDSGGIVVTGAFRGVSDLGGGPLAAAAGRAAGFLARFGADGGHLWSRALTDPDADVFPQRLALDPAQEIVFAATLYGSFEFSGATLTTEPCCARGLVRSFTAEGAPISAALLPAPSDPDASQIVDALVVDADGRQFAAASATHDAVVHRKQLFRVDGAGWTHELVAFTNGSMEPSLVAKDGGVVLLDSCHIYACPFGEPAPSSDNPPNGSDVVAGGYDEGGALNWSSRWGGRGWVKL